MLVLVGMEKAVTVDECMVTAFAIAVAIAIGLGVGA